MITKNYIKMCEKAPKELWDKVEHCGSLIAWRSFIGIVKPCEKRKKMEGLVSFIPETLVIRTWCKDDEDIMVLKTNVDYCSVDPDKGTPIYTQEQLQEMTLKIFSPFAKIIKLSDFVSNYVKIYRGTKYEDVYWKGLYPVAIGSANEFWLMFVMYEEYSKIWTGEKWVKSQ
ncbi:MAG: hypothetical protein E3J83_04240 [Candidatus Atribacteria bacterium]|nr:MAG: hypothetical protein E3J83_04240 [Candidatus Atribacteria bacterium]